MLIVLVGGPQDGREIDAGALLPVFKFPRRGGFLTLAEQTGPPSSLLEVDEYTIGLDHGHPSRDDSGRIRYLFTRSSS